MYIFSWTYIKEKWAHTGFQKYLRNTGWMFAAKIFNLLVSFIATMVIARHLGPNNYGQLSYALSFTSIFSFIAVLGIDQVLYRDLMKFPEKNREFLGSAMTIRLIAGTIAIILCMGSAIFFTTHDISILLIFIISLSFIFNSFNIIVNEFQVRVQSKYPSIAASLVILILNVLKITIILFDKGVIYLALVSLLEPVLYAIFYLYIYKKVLNENIFTWKFDPNIAKKLLTDSWPMIFSGAFALIYARIDQVLIKNMISAQANGIYDAAVRIAEVWYFIPGIIMVSLWPAIINAKKTSEEQYENRLGKLVILLISIGIIVATITSIFAPFLMNVIYGPEFLTGVTILRIYVWSGIGVFFTTFLSVYLITENYRKIIFLSSFISMISNVLINLILIPKYGTVGSAYATLISYLLGPMTLLFFKHTREKMFLIFKSQIHLFKYTRIDNIDIIQ